LTRDHGEFSRSVRGEMPRVAIRLGEEGKLLSSDDGRRELDSASETRRTSRVFGAKIVGVSGKSSAGAALKEMEGTYDERFSGMGMGALIVCRRR
jgi:hypothetical protein